MEESARSSKCRTFKVSGSFPRGRPRKTWNEVIQSDLKERNVSKDVDVLEVFHKKPPKLWKHGKHTLQRI